jgi:signal transduction histidine kinase
METGKMEWQLLPVDMCEVCQEALTAVGQLMTEKHIQPSLSLPDHAPAVQGDRDRLIQVIINLLSNAVKFCESEGGRVNVQLSVHPDFLQITVNDNGIGIRAEDLGVIFEDFRQSRHAFRGRPSGSGLGLSITKRIVEFHGGRIWVESQPGIGATFTFTLPFTSQPQEG